MEDRKRRIIPLTMWTIGWAFVARSYLSSVPKEKLRNLSKKVYDEIYMRSIE